MSNLSLCLICFDRPSWTLHWISSFRLWAGEIHLEVQMRTSKLLPVFVCWQNVEVYATPPFQPLNDYVCVPSWSVDWKPCRIPYVSTPAIFACYINVIFSRGCYHELVWAVVNSELAMGAFFVFVATARDGVRNMVGLGNGPRLMKQSESVLLFLSPAVCEAITETAVFAVLCESDYDAVLGFVAITGVREGRCSDDSCAG